jgi:hypothetical protein
MRNEIKLIAFSLFSLLFFASSVSAYVSLTFSSTTIPTTIEPGSKANLLLTISNTGTEVATSPQLVVKSSTYVSADIAVFNLPTISAAGSTQITIPITISSSAPEGTVALPFTVSYNVGSSAGTVSADNSASITITKRTILQIADVTYDKTIIQRGDTIRMTITLQNVGRGQVKDLVISLRNFTLPIVPASSDTEKFVGTLNQDEKASVNFDLVVSNNADVVTYSIPVSLSYYDDIGSVHSETKYVGLKITGIPDFVVAIEKEENIYSGTRGTITVSIANIGTGPAKFLTAYATADDGDVNPKTNYVGNMDPDDTNTVPLDATPMKTGNHQLTLHLSYKDSYNQDFTKDYPLEFTVGTTPIQISLPFQILIVVAILVIIYWKRSSLMRLIKRK